MRFLKISLPWIAVLGGIWIVKSMLGLFVVNLLLIFIIVAVGLNLLMGYTGQVSAGHAGFLAVGAYLAAIAAKTLPSLGVFGVLASAALGTGLIGLIIGLPTLRLAGFYLTMATLAFGVVVAEAILQLKSITGGADGLYVKIPTFFGIAISTDERKFWIVLACASLTILSSMSLARSKIGRAFLALKGNPIAAEAMGINTSIYRTMAFVFSAFYTGLAGGLFAWVVGFLSPDAFSIEMSIDFLAMVIIGGVGNIWGSILGAGFLTALNHFLATLQGGRELVFGLALILCTIFMPKGLVWGIASIAGTFSQLFSNKPASGRTPTSSTEETQ